MGIETALYEIGRLDRLAELDTPVHRLDPRAKLIVTLGFVVAVVSFNRYAISALLPLLLYPVYLVGAGRLPVGYLLRKLLIATPFVLFVGIFNPVFDRAPLVEIGGVAISAGWISFVSILLRFCLTVSAALALIGVTGFATVCMALGRMGLPRAFSVQLLFLYRYLFVLTEEGLRMTRARSLRSFKGRGMGVAVYGSMLGQLLLRTMDRAQRIHQAMLCRGFDGELRLSRRLAINARDIVFVAGWLGYFALVRSVNLPQLLGRFVEGILT